MIFRRYSQFDCLRCLELFDGNSPDYFHPSDRTEFDAYLTLQDKTYFVVETEEGLVVASGGVVVASSAPQATLCWGMVDRELHRAGVGRFLLEKRLEWIMRHAPTAVEIRTETTHLTSGFFSRYGFEEVRRVPNHWGEGLDLVEMRLPVPCLRSA